MDVILFTIKVYKVGGRAHHEDRDYNTCRPEIHIYINGDNLIDLVQQVERPVLDPENLLKPSDRSYAGLNPQWCPYLRDQFLGNTVQPYSVVLTCLCHVDDCNSVKVKIRVHPTVITWKDFTTVLRGEESHSWGGTPIDYSSLGPFVFDREQYICALNALGLPG